MNFSGRALGKFSRPLTSVREMNEKNGCEFLESGEEERIVRWQSTLRDHGGDFIDVGFFHKQLDSHRIAALRDETPARTSK